ncbi:uncharacterized protein LOC116611760 [Nematostella vectensis]|uniref:uncharacterized protein LOC116611760 n=1 Tax=Nematostella vectensis TaxID=45351 RepID=UPI002076EF79|nr:uncharacterized protein LOC116611760 [Nematostella vectensis]
MAVKLENVTGFNQDSSVKLLFPKIWEYRPAGRKELSHWSKHEVPSLQLIGDLDTDHWTKLKRKHKQFSKSMNNLSYTPLPRHLPPQPESGPQRHNYEQIKHREAMKERAKTMYYTLPEGYRESSRVKKAVPNGASIYNQHAREGFKFWMTKDLVNKVSFCSKYTFGSKHTLHGLRNAPRN